MPPPREWPDERDPVVAERGEQVADAAGVRAERVVAARLGGRAVAEQVGGDHVAGLAEPAITCSHCEAREAMPCTSTTTGPAGVGAGLGVGDGVAVHGELGAGDVSHALRVLATVCSVKGREL
jgi:hypothetical protein